MYAYTGRVNTTVATCTSEVSVPGTTNQVITQDIEQTHTGGCMGSICHVFTQVHEELSTCILTNQKQRVNFLLICTPMDTTYYSYCNM